MRGLPEGVTVPARCIKTRRLFGVYFEEGDAGMWLAGATAPMDPSALDAVGDGVEIRGDIVVGVDYAGCPHCKGKFLLKCGCGRLMCWDGEERLLFCPWCGRKGGVGEGLVGNLSGTAGRVRSERRVPR